MVLTVVHRILEYESQSPTVWEMKMTKLFLFIIYRLHTEREDDNIYKTDTIALKNLKPLLKQPEITCSALICE